MRILFILLLLVAVGCNKSNKNTKSNSLGKFTEFAPLEISPEDNNMISTICGALSNKEDTLSVLVNSGLEYSFNYAEKNCSDSAAGATKKIVTTIETQNSSYRFRSKDGSQFGFSEVETTTQGVMKDLCANLGRLSSPMQSSSTGAIWFTTQSRSANCTTDSNGICIFIQRGSIADSQRYVIHSNEWIKFKVNNERRGFFTERKLVTSIGCSGGKTFERLATLINP